VYDRIRANFALRFNKVALTEANLHKWRKNVPDRFCVRSKTKWKTKEICGCRCQCSVKSKRLGWLGHVVRMEKDQTVKRIFEGHSGGRRRLVDLGSDGWIILKRILD
jgi:hypothetical protein